MQTSGWLSRVKSFILPPGRKVRTIRGGLLKGLRVPIDFSKHTQIYLGLYERENHAWIRKLSQDCTTFVDIGAAQGLISLFALARTPARKVLAFEPQQALHAEILELLLLNEVPVQDRFVLASHFVGRAPSENTRTLDELFDQLEAPVFLKIDVDGPEWEILQGATRLLKQKDVRLVIETHAPELEDACKDFLEALGYRTHIIPNAWWRFLIPEERPIPHNRWLAAYHPERRGRSVLSKNMVDKHIQRTVDQCPEHSPPESRNLKPRNQYRRQVEEQAIDDKHK